jgi:hypothetical protein
LFVFTDIFDAMGFHPSDPATPGHLPSEGRLRGFCAI